MMRVPERARVTDGPMGTAPGAGCYGAFRLDGLQGWSLYVLADDGTGPAPSARGWEHVSVRAFRDSGHERSRVPTWKEMCFVKDLFWDPDDVVIQLHPRRSEYVNNHPHVLHLWRHADIPTPPRDLV